MKAKYTITLVSCSLSYWPHRFACSPSRPHQRTAAGQLSFRCYVVVISGENSETNSNARVVGPNPGMVQDDSPGSSYYYYTQDGVTYTMRYVTVTSTDTDSELFVRHDYIMSNVDYFRELILASFEAGIAITTEIASDTIELFVPYWGILATIGEFITQAEEILTTEFIEDLDLDTMVFRSATTWTRSYIQVYNAETSLWHTAQCSSYALSRAHFDSSYIYDSETNSPVSVGGILKDTTTYSPYYNDNAMRKAQAVEGYQIGTKIYDCTGNIHFYLLVPTENTILGDEYELLFTHTESLAYLLPIVQEE